jgi:hypothetical protein
MVSASTNLMMISPSTDGRGVLVGPGEGDVIELQEDNATKIISRVLTCITRQNDLDFTPAPLTRFASSC